jgi:hypothetical protein
MADIITNSATSSAQFTRAKKKKNPIVAETSGNETQCGNKKIRGKNNGKYGSCALTAAICRRDIVLQTNQIPCRSDLGV